MTAAQVHTLKNALTSMFDAISKRQNVAEHLIKLEDLQREISPSAPAQLRHFLERRSYTKALEYLQTGAVVDDPDRPECDDPQAHP